MTNQQIADVIATIIKDTPWVALTFYLVYTLRGLVLEIADDD
jgi:hypothetical protein